MMKTKISLTAEKKACAAFAVAIAALCAAIVLADSSVLAQPEEPRAGGPAMEEDGPPRERRGEMRDDMRRNRQERQEMRRERGGRGEGGEMPGSGPAGPGEGRGGQARLGRYLEVVQSYQAAVQDGHQAVGLAALGIKDYYRRAGKPLDAVKELEGVLSSTTDQKMRNIVLFVIRQIYEEEKSGEKFIATSRQIIKENLGGK